MKGHVEIVNVYDNRYWNIFVDGVLVFETHKEAFNDYIFKRTHRQEIAKVAGVDAEDLIYSIYDTFESDLEETGAVPDYDANDYTDYAIFKKAVKKHKLLPSYKEVALDVLEESF